MKSNFKRFGILASAAALSALAVPAMAEDIKLGAFMPLTGGLQELAPPILDAARTAVNEANAAGGVLGSSVVLAVKDTRLNPQTAIDVAQKAVEIDGAVASVGPLASGIVAAVANSVTVNAKHPIITPSGTAPTLTTLQDNDLVFRTAPSDSYQGDVLGKLMVEEGVDAAAIIYINNDYGKGLSDSLSASFEAAGGKLAGVVGYDEKAAKYDADLAKLAQGGAKTLVVISYPDSGGIDIVRQSVSLGLFDRFVFTDGMRSERLVSDIGAQYLGTSFGTAPKGWDSAGLDAFKAAYAQVTDADPNGPFILNNYDAAMILLLAIEKAGSTDGLKIRDSIRAVANAPGEKVGPGEFAKAKALIAAGKDINYEGLVGSNDFDANGDVSTPYEHWKVGAGGLETVSIF